MFNWYLIHLPSGASVCSCCGGVRDAGSSGGVASARGGDFTPPLVLPGRDSTCELWCDVEGSSPSRGKQERDEQCSECREHWPVATINLGTQHTHTHTHTVQPV